MGATEHYDLYITNDLSERFMDWRLGMNGPSNSNMTKIDAALFGKAGKSKTVNLTLDADAWIGESAPYTQRLEADDITPDTNGIISLAQASSAESREAARVSSLFVTEQGDGYIVVTAYAEKPAQDIVVSITIVD